MFLIMLISIIMITLIIMGLVSTEINEKEKLEKLEKLENKEQTVEMYKKIINLNENDIIYLGKEYKVTNIISKYKGEYKTVLKHKDEKIEIFYETDYVYPRYELMFLSNKGYYLRLNWYDKYYKIGNSKKGLPERYTSRLELSNILKSLGDIGLEETCKNLRKTVKL